MTIFSSDIKTNVIFVWVLIGEEEEPFVGIDGYAQSQSVKDLQSGSRAGPQPNRSCSQTLRSHRNLCSHISSYLQTRSSADFKQVTLWERDGPCPTSHKHLDAAPSVKQTAFAFTPNISCPTKWYFQIRFSFLRLMFVIKNELDCTPNSSNQEQAWKKCVAKTNLKLIKLKFFDSLIS